jgi:hypothetical protein
LQVSPGVPPPSRLAAAGCGSGPAAGNRCERLVSGCAAAQLALPAAGWQGASQVQGLALPAGVALKDSFNNPKAIMKHRR